MQTPFKTLTIFLRKHNMIHLHKSQFLTNSLFSKLKAYILKLKLAMTCMCIYLRSLEIRNNFINGSVACKHVKKVLNLHCCSIQTCYRRFCDFLPNQSRPIFIFTFVSCLLQSSSFSYHSPSSLPL